MDSATTPDSSLPDAFLSDAVVVVSPGAAPQSPASDTSPSTEPIKVLHVINGEHYAGAERVQDLLAACLGEHGFGLSFACVKPDKFDEARHHKAAPLVETPMRSRFDHRAARQVARLVVEGQFKIIHAHTPRSLMVACWAAHKTKVPLVYHVHSPTSRDSTRRLHNWLNAMLERRNLRRAAQLICVSESLGRHMADQGFHRDRITVVPNGVPMPTQRPLRSKPKGIWHLGSVALMRPRKGIEVLLDAIAILRDRGLPVRLRLVGAFESNEYESSLKQQVERLKIDEAVDWVGFTRDVPAELAKMDLFVLPSLFGEGLPMVVLEAMAAGLPVVATQVEGVPEAIRDGREGLLAKPNSAIDLAHNIARIVGGEVDWNQLRQAAMARHAERFSDRSMAAGVASVYDRLLRG